MVSDISIDLGTSMTRIYIEGKGIVISEPSVVTIDLEDEEIVAVGKKAYDMVGKTPRKITTIYPLEGGVISDFYLVEGLIRDFFKKVSPNKIVMPKVVACIPSKITDVEKRSVVNTISAVGARRVYLIEKSIAAAIGSGIDIQQSKGNIIVNIGGGTTDIAVVSLGDSVVSSSIKVAGNQIDDEIIKYIKKTYNLLIGKCMAEKLKICIGNVYSYHDLDNFRVKGRDLLTGLPKWADISPEEISEIIVDIVIKIITEIQNILADTPPELAGDIYTEGIILTGGSANLRGIDKLIERKTNLKVTIPNEPENCVVIGAGMASKYINKDENHKGTISPLMVEY